MARHSGANRIVAGDFNMEPSDAMWAEWTRKYADVWAGVAGTTGDQGFTKDQRNGSNLPGRIDYFFIPAGAARIGVQQMSVVKTVLSDRHVLMADYIIK